MTSRVLSGQSSGQTGDTHQQFIKLDRFGQMHPKAGAEGAEAIFVAGVSGYRYNRSFDPLAPHAPDQLVTAALRHRNVGDHNFRTPAGHNLHRLDYAAGGPDLSLFQ